MAKRKSAFFQAVEEAQQNTTPSPGETVPPLDSVTVKRLHLPTVEPSHGVSRDRSGQASAAPSHRETVKPSHGNTVTAELNKTSFYLTQAQLDKLDELAYAYKQATGKRINRNDIVRFLVDHARLETLLAEW